ncbi:MAG: DUF523 domain-containing protein [Christensenellales bacterium]|jgi:uncharacterized protein YbbK (DUF523 family)
MRILVSACLIGLCTRYDGNHSQNANVLELSDRHTLVPVCPEQLGGLPTPRPPCEVRLGKVMSRDGKEKTAEFVSGAQQALLVYKTAGCQAAILKARSPSCGKGPIYDGSFTGRLTDGQGVLSKMLNELSIPVYDEEETHHFL